MLEGTGVEDTWFTLGLGRDSLVTISLRWISVRSLWAQYTICRVYLSWSHCQVLCIHWS